MFKMSSSARAFIEKNCPNLLEETDFRNFLLRLNDYIIMYGLDENDEMTTFGREAQAVYDEIYMCNV